MIVKLGNLEGHLGKASMIAKRKPLGHFSFSISFMAALGFLNHPSIRAMMRTITFDLGS